MPFRGKTMFFVIPDERLAAIVGKDAVSTPTLVKNLWKYIRANCKTEKRKIA